jgi:serine/threonine protein kinase
MMDADSTRDFRREALLLGRVDHPGIIKLYHYGKVTQPYMVGSLINFVFLSF